MSAGSQARGFEHKMNTFPGRQHHQGLEPGQLAPRTTINDMPLELLERILYFVDGASLRRSSRTAKRFKRAVENLERAAGVWYHCVINEIDPEVVAEIDRFKGALLVRRRGPVSGPFDPWADVYLKWYRGRHLHFWTCHKQECGGFLTNPVYCLKITGNLIVIGHKDGCISICDPLAGTIELATRHHRMVTDFALVDLRGQPLYRVYRSWAGSFSQHHHVVSVSKDKTVLVFPIQAKAKAVRTFGPGTSELVNVRVFNDVCAVASKFCNIYIFKMHLQNPDQVDPSVPLGFQLVTTVCYPDSSTGGINIWNNKIQLLCKSSGKMNLYDIKYQRWAPSKQLRVPPSVISTAKKHLYMTRAFLFREKVIFVVTINNQIICSTDGDHCFYFRVCEQFTSSVTSMAFWGSLIAFGLESGQMFVFHCPRTEYLTTLHLQSPIFKRQIAQNEDIISLDIGDCEDGPVIVAASHNSLSVLKWSPTTSGQVDRLAEPIDLLAS